MKIKTKLKFIVKKLDIKENYHIAKTIVNLSLSL